MPCNNSEDLTACENTTENIKTTEVIQEENIDTMTEEINDEFNKRVAALEGMTFTSEEEMESYFEENIDPSVAVFESDYEEKETFTEDESFKKKAPFEQFQICVKEIKNHKR